jgi:hypothetical protein
MEGVPGQISWMEEDWLFLSILAGRVLRTNGLEGEERAKRARRGCHTVRFQVELIFL